MKGGVIGELRSPKETTEIKERRGLSAAREERGSPKK